MKSRLSDLEVLNHEVLDDFKALDSFDEFDGFKVLIGLKVLNMNE